MLRLSWSELIGVWTRQFFKFYHRFGRPLKMDPFKEQFFSSQEGAPRAAVKRLTRAIEQELTEATVNAPDWCV